MIETPTEILEHYATKPDADNFTAWRKRIKHPLTETADLPIANTLAKSKAAEVTHRTPSHDRWGNRSKTFQGMADAWADQ